MIYYLNPADIYTMNEKIVGHKPFVRDRRTLVAACRRPAVEMFGQEAYPTLTQKAAALLHALAHDHPFGDGNKRTATEAVVRFLQENGADLAWTDAEAYQFVLEIAQGKLDVDDVSERLIDYVILPEV